MPTSARCADAALQRVVDRSILDYLLFSTTNALLVSYCDGGGETYSRSESLLRLTSSFLTIFQALHRTLPTDSDADFRLRLLKFCETFIRRRQPSLLSSHSHPPTRLTIHQYHENTFGLGEDSTPHTDFLDLSKHLCPVADELHMSTGSAESKKSLPDIEDGKQEALPANSYLDTLPSFMALSATAQIVLEETQITSMWMRLAAGYMAQAVAEQYLAFGAEQPEILRQAFSWGFDEDNDAAEGSDEFVTNAMFFDEEIEGSNTEWEAVREEHMRALIPPKNSNLQDHLRSLLSKQLSSSDFRDRVCAFLESLQGSLDKPLLSQIECGNIDGMTNRELFALRKRIDLHYE